MPAPSDEALLAGIVGELSGRFGTPLFAPHLTLLGDTETTPAVLERAVTTVADTVEAFSEPVTAVEGIESYFRSFYARFAASAPLTTLKRRLDPEAVSYTHLALGQEHRRPWRLRSPGAQPDRGCEPARDRNL